MLVPSIRICPQNLCRDWTSLMSLPNHVYLSPVFVLSVCPSLLFIAHSWHFVLRLERMTKEWWFVCCTDESTHSSGAEVKYGRLHIVPFFLWAQHLPLPGYIGLPTQDVVQCFQICTHLLSGWTHQPVSCTSCINGQYSQKSVSHEVTEKVRGVWLFL